MKERVLVTRSIPKPNLIRGDDESRAGSPCKGQTLRLSWSKEGRGRSHATRKSSDRDRTRLSHCRRLVDVIGRPTLIVAASSEPLSTNCPDYFPCTNESENPIQLQQTPPGTTAFRASRHYSRSLLWTLLQVRSRISFPPLRPSCIGIKDPFS